MLESANNINYYVHMCVCNFTLSGFLMLVLKTRANWESFLASRSSCESILTQSIKTISWVVTPSKNVFPILG